MTNRVIAELVLSGRDGKEAIWYWRILDAEKLSPAVAFFALDCCYERHPSVVRNWLCLAQRTAGDSSEVIDFLAALRRRALKSRKDWPAHRHEWTNKINQVKRRALKLNGHLAATG